MKKVTITALVPDDTNQNDLKTWVKGCPFSLAGNQTIIWENIPEPAKEAQTITAADVGTLEAGDLDHAPAKTSSEAA